MIANAFGFVLYKSLYNIVKVLVADMAEFWRIVEKEMAQERGRIEGENLAC